MVHKQSHQHDQPIQQTYTRRSYHRNKEVAEVLQLEQYIPLPLADVIQRCNSIELRFHVVVKSHPKKRECLLLLDQLAPDKEGMPRNNEMKPRSNEEVGEFSVNNGMRHFVIVPHTKHLCPILTKRFPSSMHGIIRLYIVVGYGYISLDGSSDFALFPQNSEHFGAGIVLL